MNDVHPTGLQITSDLHLAVEGLQARLVADGQHLTVETADAGRLLAQAAEVAPPHLGRPVSVRQIVDRVGRLLDDSGVSASVVDDHGSLIEIGRGVHSRAGQLLLGSRYARLGPIRVLVPVATSYLRASAVVRRRAGYAAAGAVIAVTLAAGARRRTAVVVAP